MFSNQIFLREVKGIAQPEKRCFQSHKDHHEAVVDTKKPPVSTPSKGFLDDDELDDDLDLDDDVEEEEEVIEPVVDHGNDHGRAT